MCGRYTVIRGLHGRIAGGDDGFLRIAVLELLRQGVVAELTANLGGLETMVVIGELQPVDFPLLVLHALDRDAASEELVEEHGMARQTFPRCFSSKA